ncbi:hypothetical protein AeMF1_015298, partial [Aphanomyces euteiches]
NGFRIDSVDFGADDEPTQDYEGRGDQGFLLQMRQWGDYHSEDKKHNGLQGEMYDSPSGIVVPGFMRRTQAKSTIRNHIIIHDDSVWRCIVVLQNDMLVDRQKSCAEKLNLNNETLVRAFAD